MKMYYCTIARKHVYNKPSRVTTYVSSVWARNTQIVLDLITSAVSAAQPGSVGKELGPGQIPWYCSYSDHDWPGTVMCVGMLGHECPEPGGSHVVGMLRRGLRKNALHKILVLHFYK